MLKDLLDKVWAQNGDPAAISEAVSGMSDTQVHQAAMIHFSALVGLEPTGVSGDTISFGATSARVVRSPDGKGDLEYKDIHVGFVVDGIRIDKNDGPSTMGALIDLFQYARDHSDTLLYLSPTERDERIQDMATRCGASDRFVRFLLSRFGLLHAEIAA